MDKYDVYIAPQAYREMDEIYEYIREEFHAPETAKHLAGLLEEAILSLEDMPERGAKRRVGYYGDQGYRQLFIKNFTIVYRIENQTVNVITVRYSQSDF